MRNPSQGKFDRWFKCTFINTTFPSNRMLNVLTLFSRQVLSLFNSSCVGTHLKHVIEIMKVSLFNRIRNKTEKQYYNKGKCGMLYELKQIHH